MLLEKKQLSAAQIEAQAAFELPEREMPLLFITVTALNGVSIQVPVAVAANICDVDVDVLVQNANDGDTTCEADADSRANLGRGNR